MFSATEAEIDEMWSFVHDKKQQYWLWWPSIIRLEFCLLFVLALENIAIWIIF